METCFVCLGGEEDSGWTQQWIKPCHCSLYAHRSCFASWIQATTGKKKVHCPQCRAPLKVGFLPNTFVNMAESLERVTENLVLGSCVTIAAGVAAKSAMVALSIIGREYVVFMCSPSQAARFLGKSFWYTGTMSSRDMLLQSLPMVLASARTKKDTGILLWTLCALSKSTNLKEDRWLLLLPVFRVIHRHARTLIGIIANWVRSPSHPIDNPGSRGDTGTHNNENENRNNDNIDMSESDEASGWVDQDLEDLVNEAMIMRGAQHTSDNNEASDITERLRIERQVMEMAIRARYQLLRDQSMRELRTQHDESLPLGFVPKYLFPLMLPLVTGKIGSILSLTFPSIFGERTIPALARNMCVGIALVLAKDLVNFTMSWLARYSAISLTSSLVGSNNESNESNE